MVFKAENTTFREEHVRPNESIANRMANSKGQPDPEAVATAAAAKQAKVQQDARTSMSLFDYQLAAVKTAIYPEAGTGSFRTLSYLFALLAEEAGEANGKWAKFQRDSADANETRNLIKGELGDVLWALANLANEMDLSLSEVAKGNLEKLASRQERGVLGGSGDNR